VEAVRRLLQHAARDGHHRRQDRLHARRPLARPQQLPANRQDQAPRRGARHGFFFHEGILCDLLWSDPEVDFQGWGESERGVSYIFGADIVANFLKKHDLDLICRAHQVTLLSKVVEDGYEFFGKRQLVTIFSAPDYCQEFDNAGSFSLKSLPHECR